jgi:F-type H+/Na+-transporting ATPase subunit alpha
LTADLFDPVPLERMTDAEQAVRETAAQLPTELVARLEAADTLSDGDRKTMIAVARQALERFQPEVSSQPEPQTEPCPEPEPAPEVQPNG